METYNDFKTDKQVYFATNLYGCAMEFQDNTEFKEFKKGVLDVLDSEELIWAQRNLTEEQEQKLLPFIEKWYKEESDYWEQFIIGISEIMSSEKV